MVCTFVFPAYNIPPSSKLPFIDIKVHNLINSTKPKVHNIIIPTGYSATVPHIMPKNLSIGAKKMHEN